ncbi:MAG: NAD(P)/FAD-dependent oxidoreductase [Porticoccaceae bacterium]|nr:NAD(P)/FAD-dependent oxidoreductase [Porticoccaceae bacterium]MBT6114164.1 NAD(P)/FAD-dependent oxidoreductase [Porticoccaceae bacterium]
MKTATTNSGNQSVDVLIIGAGLSGIGGACHLRRNCPDRSFMILESREASGGTWDLFRYPGIRSDSDMYTFGYGFKPWSDKSSIADGHKILRYIREAAAEYDVEQHIRYQHKVLSANWSSTNQRWLVTAELGDTGEQVTIDCQFIFSCSGYYDYDQGYTPEFAGIDKFKGQVVHAQHWPEKLNYKDKRVVVIGSGATAVTLVPTMSKDTASLVMLQRSPTYIASVPKEQPLAEKLRKWLPDRWVFRLTRWSRVFFQIYLYQLSRKKPQQLKKLLLGRVRQEMGPDYDVDTHFTPDYNPWDQRLCAVPDGDLFAAIREGRAEVVTDHIDHFNKEGIELKSGQQLDADIVVLATGLNLKFAGGVQYSVDNRVLDFTEHFIFRGMMFSGLPNMAFTVGYTNSSWTLKADLTAKYVSRLLNKMTRRDYTSVTPRLKGEVEEVPLLDFDAGYVLRSRESFPKQGNRLPWKNYQNYIRDFIGLSLGRQNDDELEFR